MQGATPTWTPPPMQIFRQSQNRASRLRGHVSLTWIWAYPLYPPWNDLLFGQVQIRYSFSSQCWSEYFFFFFFNLSRKSLNGPCMSSALLPALVFIHMKWITEVQCWHQQTRDWWEPAPPSGRSSQIPKAISPFRHHFSSNGAQGAPSWTRIPFAPGEEIQKLIQAFLQALLIKV